MRRIIIAVGLIVLLATSASAYDFLYTGDTAMTHDAGAFGVTGNFVYLMADSWYDSDGEKQDAAEGEKLSVMAIPIDVYYSVMDNFELGIQPKFMSYKYEWDEGQAQRATEEATGTGLGDTWLWAKYMFMDEPIMTGRLAAKLNTGDDEPDEGDLATGDGQMDIDAAVLFAMPAGPGNFDAAVGYRIRMENDDKVKPGNEIHFAAAYTYFMNDMMNLKLGADGFFGSDAEVDGDAVDESGSNAVWINPGLEYMMDNGMTVGAGFHYPLMGTNIEALWGFDVFVGWGM